MIWWVLIVASAAWFGFAYVGYPLVLAVLARVSPRPFRSGETSPPLSVIIAVHNGGERLRHKLEETLALDYPGSIEVIVASDGTILAWGDDTRLISLWHLPSNRQIGEDLTGHREPISDLEFADVDQDGVDGLLASTSDDATTRVWEIRARRLVARIEAHRQDVTAVAISPQASVSSHGGSPVPSAAPATPPRMLPAS